MKIDGTHTYILASSSPRRKELIRHIGIEPVICPSTLEEHADTSDPETLTRTLALQKAEEVAAHYNHGEVVIGADTCVYVPHAEEGGRILGKPASHEDAARMIRLLSGHTHQVFTGVALVRCDASHKTAVFAEQTVVTVFPMSDDEIAAYAALDEPMDKAGAYGIQGPFSRFIARLDGDYFNVVGLPLGRLYQELKTF